MSILSTEEEQLLMEPVPLVSHKPLLSVIIALVSDTINPVYDLSNVCGCIEALREQHEPPDMEIIIPYPAQCVGIRTLKGSYPEVTFLPFSDLKTYPPASSSREHHDELRARAIAASNGEIIALLEDYDRPDATWSRAVVDAHRQHYAGVGGAIENGVNRSLNWAVYFCDFGRYQNPIHDGESLYASDANVAYKCNALVAIRPIWQHSFQETSVNTNLRQRGEKLALSSRMVVYQHRKSLSLSGALKERYVWGRSFAATRSAQLGVFRRLMHAALSPLLPVVLVTRMALNVRKKRRENTAFVKALPLILLLSIFWSFGELVGDLTMQANTALSNPYPNPRQETINE